MSRNNAATFDYPGDNLSITDIFSVLVFTLRLGMGAAGLLSSQGACGIQSVVLFFAQDADGCRSSG